MMNVTDVTICYTMLQRFYRDVTEMLQDFFIMINNIKHLKEKRQVVTFSIYLPACTYKELINYY